MTSSFGSSSKSNRQSAYASSFQVKPPAASGRISTEPDAMSVSLLNAYPSQSSSALCGRWTLLGSLFALLAATVGVFFGGRKLQKAWLLVAGLLSSVVVSILLLLVAANYADAVFAVAVFFLVGIPTLGIVTMLIPVTTVAEIFRRMFPDGYRTVIRAFQMLLSVFFGILFFVAVLLLFPPHNSVAFLFIV